MKITKEFLESKKACEDGLEYVTENQYLGLEAIPFLEKLISNDKLSYANWLLPRVMEYKDYVAYAIFAAEQVIDIFEKEYPNDTNPRKAIESAKECLKNPTEENRKKAKEAASAAYAAAASAAYAAAATYATYTAYTAAAAAGASAAAAAGASDANAAAYAAYAYTNASDDTRAIAAAAKREMQLKVLDYGLTLLKL